ncbi:stress-responsive transcription factor hsf1 [Ceratobasidium sp. 414]|nr:stress-responsive transcription factor hsf1 [Ceratobasidium sp. 414]
MATTTDQLALTKANRAPTISTSTRQAVPAFLNKLYNMVNNPDTDELVRWSDEGDSFFIPSHERLSKELLPRFFKHGNFSSFVRQLNMYGFHKVPHLQQGVLQNSTETELWQFQNPHFQRGQPDLLCLITRKKTGANADNAVDEAQNSAAAGPTPNANHSAGPLDMTVLNSSLTAIKKHQTSLSAELKTLQESNQHLWNEALAARDRHKKHQDTINKILKFLASVFGNGAAGATPSASAGSSSNNRDGRASPGALVPRKRPRLMIENGSADEEDLAHFGPHGSPDMSMLSDEQDEEMAEGRISEAPQEAPPIPAARPEQPPATPKAEPPPTPALDSAAPTPTNIPSASSPPAATNNLQVPPAASIPTTSLASPMNTVARRPSSQSTNVPSSGQASVSAVTPTNPPPSTPASSFSHTDEHAQEQMYQEAITKLLSSPNALQRILAMVSSQGPEHPPAFPESQSELAPYYGGLMNMALDTPPDPLLAYGAARLDQSTEALNQGVASTEQEINNLMQEWGITPEMLQDHHVDAQLSNGFAHPTGFDQSHAFAPNSDFTHINGIGAPNQSAGFASIAPEGEQVDIDSFLNQFEFPEEPNISSSSAKHPSQHTTRGISDGSAFPVPLAAEFDLANPGPHSASFLDEVHPVPSGTSDTSLSPAIPLLDDFSQAATAAPSSPTTVRFPTPSKSVPGVTTIPIMNGVAPAVLATKRGRKRRSGAGETPAMAVEDLATSTRAPP